VVAAARRAGKRIGVVPTMGALHAGHASLLRAARQETEFVVATIFVNPAQFGPNEDLTRYPRPLQDDLKLCATEGVDLVFTPEPAAVYPPDFGTYVEVHGLQEVLEGASRPGHFRGVATVVLKLFNIVQPDRAYFGQKDAQQVRIIQQMVRDLNVPVQIRVLPTVREPDGLALSSRNQFLDAEQRRSALCLHAALEGVRQCVQRGERDAQLLCRTMESRIRGNTGVDLDYAVIVDAETLQPLRQVQGRALVAVATRVGTTRLIDNIVLESSDSPS
jgi:pantoate--beta-alanine ligase